MKECKGHIYISVLEGRNLVVHPAVRPSVAFQLGKELAQTDPLEHGSVKWLTEFRLNVFSQNASLVVILMDAHRQSPIGRASVMVRDCVGTDIEWVTFKDVDGKDVGEVCLVLRFLDQGVPLKTSPTRSSSESNGCHYIDEVSSPALCQNGSSPQAHEASEERSEKKSSKSRGEGRADKLLLLAGTAAALILAAFSVTNHRLQRKPRYHEVKPGETLCSIADCYGLSADDIFEANITVTTDPDKLFPGDKLHIP